MWSQYRRNDVVHLVFAGTVSADEIHAAAASVRDATGDTPFRLCVETAAGDVSLGCVWILFGILDDSPIADVVVIGAPRKVRASFNLVCATARIPVSHHVTPSVWQASERQVGTLAPPHYLAEICVGF